MCSSRDSGLHLAMTQEINRPPTKALIQDIFLASPFLAPSFAFVLPSFLLNATLHLCLHFPLCTPQFALPRPPLHSVRGLDRDCEDGGGPAGAPTAKAGLKCREIVRHCGQESIEQENRNCDDGLSLWKRLTHINTYRYVVHRAAWHRLHFKNGILFSKVFTFVTP